jgi:hypothetical protein
MKTGMGQGGVGGGFFHQQSQNIIVGAGRTGIITGQQIEIAAFDLHVASYIDYLALASNSYFSL